MTGSIRPPPIHPSMALDLAPDLVPLLAGTVLTMVVGAAWYGALARPWMAMAHPGKTRADLDAGPKWPYAVAFAAALVMSAVYGVLATAAGRDLPTLLLLSLLLGGVLVATYLTTYSFAMKPLTLALIDVGYYVVSLFVLALLYAFL